MPSLNSILIHEIAPRLIEWTKKLASEPTSLPSSGPPVGECLEAHRSNVAVFPTAAIDRGHLSYVSWIPPQTSEKQTVYEASDLKRQFTTQIAGATSLTSTNFPKSNGDPHPTSCFHTDLDWTSTRGPPIASSSTAIQFAAFRQIHDACGQRIRTQTMDETDKKTQLCPDSEHH